MGSGLKSVVSDPESHESRLSSQSSHRRFYELTHLIPSPGEFRKFKRVMPWVVSLPVVVATSLAMLGLGVALEIGIAVSYRNGGFPVPARNVFQIASTQFLLSFFPTILVMPVAFVWRELDWYLRYYQPYVILSKGNAPAEETLLLDYISLGYLASLLYAMKYKHRIVTFSVLTALFTYTMQPLAGTVLQIQDRPQIEKANVTSVTTIALSPDVNQLVGFSSSAGFVQAAVFNNLTDPPFIKGGWTTSEFIFPPYPGFNGSMTVITTGIQSDPRCDNPAETPVVSTTATGVTISARSIDNCVITVPLSDAAIGQQYGVVNNSCGTKEALEISQQPVMFWFFRNQGGGTGQEARVVFCKPTIVANRVRAAANLNNGLLTNVSKIDEYATDNSVFGDPNFGRVFNGVVFANQSNPFVQARATATSNGVSGAIFRAAAQRDLQEIFKLPNGFLDITSTIYRQHLALSAKSSYFIRENSTLIADRKSYVPRLWINQLAGHLLAMIMIGIGLVGIVLHVLNFRQRRKLNLTTSPGTIAATVALTSRSGWGDLLLPYDDEDTIERKLSGLRFRFDARTGAIVAHDTLPPTRPTSLSKEDDSRMALLSPEFGHHRRLSTIASSTFSDTLIGSDQDTSYKAPLQPNTPGYPPWNSGSGNSR